MYVHMEVDTLATHKLLVCNTMLFIILWRKTHICRFMMCQNMESLMYTREMVMYALENLIKDMTSANKTLVFNSQI